jgi:phosphoribosyl-ATP pyrophosphohydrolase
MTTSDSDGPLSPVLILDASGVPVLAAITNTKGYNKSLENGVLWAVDGATGRLLPLTDLAEGAGPAVAAALASAGRRPDARYIQALERRDGAVLVRTDLGFGAAGAGASRAAESAAPTSGGPVSASSGAALPAAFLYELQETIRGRKAAMPEGSYTTHLFKAGLGKIRKKTGEEAIELLLAQTPEETVSEASDLLYHLMVLLVALDIPVDRVFEELRRR